MKHIDLQLYGWNSSLEAEKQNSSFSQLQHGRVAVSHKTCYEVVAESGTYTCELTGNLLYSLNEEQFPCTGDWVLFQAIEAEKGIIYQLFARRKTLYRLKTGSKSERQAIAAHVDKAFVVQSLDQGFNIRRAERFLLQLAEESITPILVFTKTDLGFPMEEAEKAVLHLKKKAEVFFTSIQKPESIEALRGIIVPGETIVFTGMSGVGKSTLINALLGNELFDTGEISTSTGKGKHTTTRREMVLLPNAGVLIDTPGIKLLGITNTDHNQLAEMLDIDLLGKECRYSDCQHENEQGCAVRKALQNGKLEQAIYENYLKMKREAWHYSSSVHEKRKHEKGFAKMVKEVMKHKKK